MLKSKPLPGRPSRAPTPAPKHLEAPERKLWSAIIQTHRFDDAASLSLLTSTIEAHQRARRCREAVDRDGECLADRFGQLKPHPLLAAERDARAAFFAGMKMLNLDLAGDAQ